MVFHDVARIFDGQFYGVSLVGVDDDDGVLYQLDLLIQLGDVLLWCLLVALFHDQISPICFVLTFPWTWFLELDGTSCNFPLFLVYYTRGNLL